MIHYAEFAAEDLLVCPRCAAADATWLHQGGVEYFWREEEDGESVSFQVTKSGDLPEERPGNPSSRRDGMQIHFWCEWCGPGIFLTIAQHKGQTFLGWAFTDRVEDEEE